MNDPRILKIHPKGNLANALLDLPKGVTRTGLAGFLPLSWLYHGLWIVGLKSRTAREIKT